MGISSVNILYIYLHLTTYEQLQKHFFEAIFSTSWVTDEVSTLGVGNFSVLEIHLSRVWLVFICTLSWFFSGSFSSTCTQASGEMDNNNAMDLISNQYLIKLLLIY
jgi:hypothetical protein